MNFKTKNANDLISKDNKISTAAARAVIESGDVETFKILSEKSDFLFDFIKRKIIQNLTNAVTKENLENLFPFTKIYNRELGEFLTTGFVKFADDNITKKMLQAFKEGTNEEMAYAALYFYHINTPGAVSYLNKFAFSEYEPLAENCASALRKYNDRNLYDESIRMIQDKEIDDFEKYKYVNFLVSYGDKDAFNVLFDYLKTSFTKGFLASSILYLTNFSYLISEEKEDEAIKLFDIIIGGYPEEISLETVSGFEILDFLKYLKNVLDAEGGENPYIKRVLLKVKNKFNLVFKEDVYTFDLSNDAKKEIQAICGFINTLQIDLFKGLEEEFQNEDKERVLESFDVVLNFGEKKFAPEIAKVVTDTDEEEIISEGIRVLKNLGAIDLVNKEIAEKIKNENLKALTLSYF